MQTKFSHVTHQGSLCPSAALNLVWVSPYSSGFHTGDVLATTAGMAATYGVMISWYPRIPHSDTTAYGDHDRTNSKTARAEIFAMAISWRLTFFEVVVRVSALQLAALST